MSLYCISEGHIELIKKWRLDDKLFYDETGGFTAALKMVQSENCMTIICRCQVQDYIYWIISTENDHRHHHTFIKYDWEKKEKTCSAYLSNKNNFGYEKITIVVDNIPLIWTKMSLSCKYQLKVILLSWYSVLKFNVVTTCEFSICDKVNPKIIVVFRTDLHKMKIKHRIIGEYATKRCFFDIKKLAIVTGS
jgi:hypothetical protein